MNGVTPSKTEAKGNAVPRDLPHFDHWVWGSAVSSPVGSGAKPQPTEPKMLVVYFCIII